MSRYMGGDRDSGRDRIITTTPDELVAEGLVVALQDAAEGTGWCVYMTPLRAPGCLEVRYAICAGKPLAG